MFVNNILAGAIIMASFTIALFFLRFWKSTHDRFFSFFSPFPSRWKHSIVC